MIFRLEPDPKLFNSRRRRDGHPTNQIAITSIVAAGPFHMPHGRANVQYKAKCAVKPRRFSHRVSSNDVTVTSDMVVVFNIRRLKIYALRALYLPWN